MKYRFGMYIIYCKVRKCYKTHIGGLELYLVDGSIKSSALLEHLSQDIDPKCEFNPENIKILDTCSGDLQLRYAESIHLKYSKQTLNTQERSIPLHIV